MAARVGLTNGRYLWFAESDDYADLRFLERLVGMLEANPQCGLACSESWYVVDDDDRPPTSRTNASHWPENGRWRLDYVADGRAECAAHLIRCNTMPNASAAVIRRSTYEQVGGVDPSMRLCGDWMLWVRLLLVSDLAHVGDPLNYYRCHTAAVRSKNRATATTTAEVYRIIAAIRAHVDVEPALLEEVLDARARKLVASAVEQRYTPAGWWRAYRAARRADPRAASRIGMEFSRMGVRWCRVRAGTVRRRLIGAGTRR